MAIVFSNSDKARCVNKREWDIQRREDLVFTINEIMYKESKVPLELVNEYNDLTLSLIFKENARSIADNTKIKEFICRESEKRVENLAEKIFKEIKELSPFCKQQ